MVKKQYANKPPHSKIIEIIKEDKDLKLSVKETVRGKWRYFAVEHKKDKINRQQLRMRTIADEIALRQKLVDAGTIESFLLSNSSLKDTAENRGLNNFNKEK